MSGIKEGSVDGGDSGLGIPVGAALLPVAVGVGVLAGGIVIGRGMVRASKAVYDSVYNIAENAVRKEMEKIEQKITDALKITGSNDISHLYVTPSFEDILKLALSAERKEVENIENLISFFSREKKVREEYESKKGLRDDISKEIEREIEEYKKRKKEKEDALIEKENKVKELKRLETEKEKKKLVGYLNYIYNICNVIEELYPDIVAKVRKELVNIRLEKSNLDMFISKHRLEEKLKHIHTPSIRENLMKLTSIRLIYEANPLIQKVEGSKKEEFLSAIKAKRAKAENNYLVEEDLSRLDEIFESHLKEAKIMDRRNRFEEAQGKIIKGFKDRGYKTFTMNKIGGYFIIEGTKKDGKKASISILLPEIEDETLPRMRIEINQYGYGTKDEWNNEGRALAKEIESLGIVIDFKEMMTHFKGRLLENSVEMLKKELESKFSDKEFEVKLEDDSHISINGIKLLWSAESKVGDVLSLYNETTKEKIEVREKERIKEGI